MSFISDKNQKERLKKMGINIKTKYIVDGNILERNSNDSHNDNINKGVIYEKQYYLNDILIETIKEFDSRIEYSFISNDNNDIKYVCPNCGNKFSLIESNDSCPYCGSYYNMEYIDKDLGGKYHYDRIIRSSKYRIITAIVDYIVCLLIMFLFISFTSRTFNIYDISKIFIYAFILSLLLYYLFYIVDAYIILGPIKKYKDKKNLQQIEFWNRTKIDKKKFFNNLNYEISKFYYNNSNIIDFDIIDFDDYIDENIDGVLYVSVMSYVRFVKYNKGKISINYSNELYKMKRIIDSVIDVKDGININQCRNCGASIDVTKEKCVYCQTPIGSITEWKLVK